MTKSTDSEPMGTSVLCGERVMYYTYALDEINIFYAEQMRSYLQQLGKFYDGIFRFLVYVHFVHVHFPWFHYIVV